MPGRGDGLRRADRQAEDMAVPSAISEESLLRVPQDDLLKKWLEIAPKRKEMKTRKRDTRSNQE